jgi:molybdopterin converting factor small subunit
LTVEVRLFATLAQFLPADSTDGSAVVDVPEGSTIADVARRLGIPSGFDRVLLLNGVEAEPDQQLGPGDVVDIFPPLAGGATGPRPAPHGGSATKVRISKSRSSR